MKLLMKVDSLGHQKSLSMKVLVQNCPACPRVGVSCKEETRDWQVSGETYIQFL